MKTAVASRDEVRNSMKDFLWEQRYPLKVTLRHALLDVAGEMFSKNLISNSVKDNPSYEKMIGEFEAGMK